MSDPLIISALVRKRAELAGELLDAERLRRSVVAKIAYIDHVLLFGYEGEPGNIPAKRRRAARVQAA